MKTPLIAFLTFMIGLFVGAGYQLTNRAASGHAERAAEELSVAEAKRPAPLPVTSRAATDVFAEWESAIRAGKLTDAKLRAQLLEGMAALDPARAWRLMLESGVPVVLADIERVARLWQRLDARAAADFALTLTDPLHRPALLRQVLTGWFFDKPQELAAWLDTQPEGRTGLISHINWSNMVYERNLFTLADLDAMMHMGPPTDSFPDIVAAGFHEVWKQPQQRQAATDWLRNLDDVEVRDSAWGRLIDSLSQDEPRAATAMLDEISDPTKRRKASSTIAARLARTDPQAALAYADTLSDPQASTAARKSALGTWAVTEPKQALEFVRQNQQTYTPEDLAPAGRQLAENKPEEALEAIAGFPGSAGRSDLMRDVFREWFRNAPKDAKAWLDSVPAGILPASDVAELRKSLPQPGNTNPSSHSMTINGRRVNYSY